MSQFIVQRRADAAEPVERFVVLLLPRASEKPTVARDVPIVSESGMERMLVGGLLGLGAQQRHVSERHLDGRPGAGGDRYVRSFHGQLPVYSFLVRGDHVNRRIRDDLLYGR